MKPHYNEAPWILGDSLECEGVIQHDMAPRLEECLVALGEVRLLEDYGKGRVYTVSVVLAC